MNGTYRRKRGPNDRLMDEYLTSCQSYPSYPMGDTKGMPLIRLGRVKSTVVRIVPGFYPHAPKRNLIVLLLYVFTALVLLSTSRLLLDVALVAGVAGCVAGSPAERGAGPVGFALAEVSYRGH